jgi:hypothetical protein
MTDPHVQALQYRLVPRKGITYQEGLPAVERDCGAFSVRLEDEVLRVTMRDHYESIRDAEAAVRPYLDAWRVDAALRAGRVEFDFEYVDAEVVDRAASSGDVTIVGRAAAALAVRISGKVEAERGSYPDPPVGFEIDLDTEALWNRWQGYVEGREPLQGMAYFCVTVLQLDRGRAGAHKRFAVSLPVLRKIAELSTETGEPGTTARKATAKLRPMTDSERAWLEAAVKALVRRAGEVAARPGAALPQIEMSDLPKR